MAKPGKTLLLIAVLGAVLLMAACGGGSGPSEPPPPPLQLSITTTEVGFDRISFKVVPNRAAAVTASYGPTSSCGLTPVQSGDQLVAANLIDATSYHICATAQAGSEPQVSATTSVTTAAFPNFCTTAWEAMPKDTITIHVRYNEARFTTSIVVNLVALCGGETYKVIPKPASDNGIIPVDGGYNFSRQYLVPRRALIGVQAGEYVNGSLQRWKPGSEFRLYPRSDSTRAVNPVEQTSFTVPSGCAPGNCFDGTVWKVQTVDSAVGIGLKVAP